MPPKSFKCPECGQAITKIVSIRTYAKDMYISVEGNVSLDEEAEIQYISTDAYECPECQTDLSSFVKDF